MEEETTYEEDRIKALEEERDFWRSYCLNLVESINYAKEIISKFEEKRE